MHRNAVPGLSERLFARARRDLSTLSNLSKGSLSLGSASGEGLKAATSRQRVPASGNSDRCRSRTCRRGPETLRQASTTTRLKIATRSLAAHGVYSADGFQRPASPSGLRCRVESPVDSRPHMASLEAVCSPEPLRSCLSTWEHFVQGSKTFPASLMGFCRAGPSSSHGRNV